MKNSAVIFFDEGIKETDIIIAGRKTYELIEEALSRSSFDGDIYYSIPEDFSISIKDKKLITRSKNNYDGWISLFEETSSDNIIKIFADSPFIDSEIISEMLTIHTEYIAEFTYSENLPSGLACEIFSAELVKMLPKTDEKILPISDVIKKNINNFDVELYYKAPDLRDKRISFRTKNKRDKEIMERMISNNKIPAYSEIRELIENNPEILYIAPSYYEIELTGKRNFSSITSVLPALKNKREDMPISLLEKIISSADELSHEYAVSFAGSGDPINHSDFIKACDIALKSPYLSMLIIETDAVFSDEALFDYLSSQNDKRIKIIAEINGYDSETYSKVHSSSNFDSAYKNVLKFKEILGKESVYVQIQKINETETFLDKYYDFWEKEDFQIILMKQNTYLGLLEDRKYYDLSPIERTPCWHLQRDLFILADGRVPFCRQDIEPKSADSISETSLREIWNKRIKYFLDNYKKEYPAVPDCSICDEWYSFYN